MSIMRDNVEGWIVEFPGQRLHACQSQNTVESGPEVTVLHDRTKTTTNPTTLSVTYTAKNPVTITWRVDGDILCKKENRVRQGETSLKLSRWWFEEHDNSTYEVIVCDQNLRRRNGVNPISSFCNITIE